MKRQNLLIALNIDEKENPLKEGYVEDYNLGYINGYNYCVYEIQAFKNKIKQ
jgi:hypothetical protein